MVQCLRVFFHGCVVRLSVTRLYVLKSSNIGRQCLLCISMAWIAFASPAALAQVDNDFSAGGGVRIGWSSSVCNSTIAGALRYNSGSGGTLDLCSGTVWKNTGAAGTLALDVFSDVRADYTKFNLFLGHEAPALSVNSKNNTSAGVQALDSLNDAGGYGNNVALGYNALTSMIGGYGGQIAVGSRAFYSKTGAQAGTAVGFEAAYSAVSSDGVTAIGYQAVRGMTGHGNTCVGYNCLNISGYRGGNTALGYNAGGANNTGSYNILIGAGVQVFSGGNSWQLNIGDLIYGNISASKFLGVNKIAPAYMLDVSGDIAYTGIMTDISDRRLKTDIANLPPALPQLMALQPVSFTMKNNPAKKIEYGFIAQEVRKIYPALVVQADDADKTLSMNYMGLLAPLVETMQEQQAIIDKQEKRIEALEKQIVGQGE